MIKNFLIGFILLCVIAVAVLGTRYEHHAAPPIEFFSDMKRQSKVKFQKPDSLFADHRGARPPVEGTIPMGYDIPGHSTQNSETPADIRSPLGEYTAGTDYYNTGRMGTQWGTGLPMNVSTDLLRQGQKEFTINCAVCHGAAGLGNGVTTKYGLLGVANYHQDKYLKMPDGQLFNTITYGYNTMMGYGDKITVKDRWAIVSYIRALQRSQNSTINDVPEPERKSLDTRK